MKRWVDLIQAVFSAISKFLYRDDPPPTNEHKVDGKVVSAEEFARIREIERKAAKASLKRFHEMEKEDEKRRLDRGDRSHLDSDW